MTTAQPEPRSVDQARSAGDGFVNSRAFEVISRAGFVARACGVFDHVTSAVVAQCSCHIAAL